MGGGNPFKQVTTRERETHQGADNRVAHQPGLMREKYDHQTGLNQRVAKFHAQCADMAA